MKKYLVILVLSLLAISCSKYGEGSYEINGTAKGFKDGTKLFLRQLNETGMIVKTIDSCFIVNQKFDLKGKVEEASMVTLLAENEETNFNLILEEGKFTLNLVKGGLMNSKISGSYNNDMLQKFNAEFTKLQQEVSQKLINYEEKHRLELTTALKAADSATVRKLKSEYFNINKQLTNYTFEFVKSNPKAYLSVLILEGNMHNKDIDFAEIKTNFDALDSKLKEVASGKRIQEKIMAVDQTEIGKEAPNFVGKTPQGKEISLKDVKGKKVTVIDFWASWCAPCRIENRNLVQLHKDFGSKGLNIVSVSLDNNDIEWRAAIFADELKWYQISNLKGWQDPIAVSYNVMAIPSTFILDADGKIVAKNLKGEELRKKVLELTK